MEDNEEVFRQMAYSIQRLEFETQARRTAKTLYGNMSDQQALLEMRFKRYLHYGSELPIYVTTDRFALKSYNKKNIPSLVKMANEEDPEKIVNIMLKVVNEKTSVWPDSITFALAFCACQERIDLQTAAYKVFRDVCKSERDMLLFVKFYREFKDTESKKKGGGWGFKRAIARWYLVLTPFDLAHILLNQRSYFGYSHADVLRLSHVKAQTLEQNVLLSYAAKGLKNVEKRFGDSTNEQVKELIDYIKSVERFRKLKDSEDVKKELSLALHSLVRVPHSVLCRQEVWDELIPTMDVKTLLQNFQRISKQGFFKNNNETVMKVTEVFNNVKKAEEFEGHPIRVYIEHNTYERAATYCLDIAKKLNHPISKLTPAKKPPKVNLVIKSALMDFYLSLHKFQKPTNLRYFVAVDVRSKMSKDRCHGSLHLSPLEAASAMCVSLSKIEPEGNVTIGTFKEDNKEIDLVSFSKGHSCDLPSVESEFKIRQAKIPPDSLEDIKLKSKTTTSTTPAPAATKRASSATTPASSATTPASSATKRSPAATTTPAPAATTTPTAALPPPPPAKNGVASVASAIDWATVNKKPFDVFIILSNYNVFTRGTRVAIQKYRAEMELPNTKVVTCSLSGKIKSHKDVEGHNMLCVIGFDEHVPRLIEAFAKGAF